MEYDISDRNFAKWWIVGGNGNDHLDPATLNLRRHEVRTDFVTDTDVNARLNFEHPFSFGDAAGSFRFGGATSPRRRTGRRGSAGTVSRGPHHSPLGNDVRRELPAHRGGRYQIGGVVDWGMGQRFLDQHFETSDPSPRGHGPHLLGLARR
jgi:hypothetical protein